MNIYCEFEDSSEDNIEICKYCKTINYKPSGKFISRVCPKLLENRASDPNAHQITLSSVSKINKDGSKVVSLINNNDKFFNSWWNSNERQKQIVYNLPQPYTLSKSEQENLLNKQIDVETKQCTQEQIDERMTICKGCEFFKDNTCLKCGCALSRERNYMNKLYYPDKSCPIGKWGPIE